MKKIFIAITLIFTAVLVNAQGIEFEHGTFSEALTKAKNENKLVFMDCYTSWCGPCKWMAKTVFTQKEVGDYFNEQFVNIKVDMEKGEGPKLKKRYPQVKAFPTLLFINVNGEVVHTVSGGGDASMLMGEAKKANDPSKRIDALEARFNKGDRKPEFVVDYLTALSAQGNHEKVKQIAQEFLSKLSNNELIDKNNFAVLQMVGVQYSSPCHLFIKENKEKFAKLVGEQEINQFLFYIHTGYVGRLMNKTDVTFEKLNKELAVYLKAFPDERAKSIARMGYKENYLKHEMYEEYFDLCEKYIVEDLKISSQEGVRSMISAVYSLALESKYAQVKGVNEWVIKYSEKAIELSPEETEPYLFLAAVYKRLGKKNRAVKNVEIYLEKMDALGLELKKDKLKIVEKIKGV